MSFPLRKITGVCGAMTTVFSSGLVAAAEAPHPDGAPINMTVTMLKTAGGLILIIGLILIAVWLLRRFGGRNLRGATMNSLIKILDTRMLGPKKYVSVLSIGTRTLAVGVTEQHITLLAEIAADDIPAPETIPAAVPAFADILKKLARRGGN